MFSGDIFDLGGTVRMREFASKQQMESFDASKEKTTCN
jgi:hypothetical protein